MRLLGTATAAALLLSVPAAQAAWSAPERVGAPAYGLTPDTLVFSPQGGGLVTALGEPAGITRRTPVPPTTLATLPPGGGPARTLGAVREEVRPIVTHGEQTIALRRRFVRRDRDFNAGVRLGVSFGTVESPLGAFVPLDRYVQDGPIDLAVNARGDAVAMWTEVRRGDRVATRVSVRRGPGGFARPRTIAVQRESRRGSAGRAVAITPAGEALVALERVTRRRGRRIRRVRIATLRDGGRLGRRQDVGPHLGYADVALEAAANGRVVVAWLTQDLGEEANVPLQVWAATREPGATRFAAARRLEAEGGISRAAGRGRFRLAVGADGSALLTWAAARGERFPFTYPVRVASAAPAAGFAPAQVVAPHGIPGDVALAPDGSAAVTWTTAEEENEQDGVQAFAALRAPGAELFGPAEPVSPVERAEAPLIAYDPAAGRPVVAWSGAPGSPPGTDADGETGRRSLSIARYAAGGR